MYLVVGVFDGRFQRPGLLREGYREGKKQRPCYGSRPTWSGLEPF